MYDIKALYEAQSVDDAVHLMQQHPQAQIIAAVSYTHLDVYKRQEWKKRFLSMRI